MNGAQGQEWRAFYDRFPYFATDKVRAGCHPRIFVHRPPSDKAIVRVHGLTDSPYFLTAIAWYFYTQLGYDAKAPFHHRVFAAHSEGDETAAIQGVANLQKKTAAGCFTPFYIPKAVGVSHAELVLEAPIRALDAAAGDTPLENANPQFEAMMAAVAQFEGTR